ncbi:MAG TPA: hypothetical protein VHA30_03560 [Patescibacteria group bacterium]|nr:hypothetical protein [Patescibacteria group bacterium]
MLKHLHKQIGQTLIETIVAAFVLVMGISAAVGLAIYALGTSTGVSKEIIAVGLAREGIEAVKNMRDTNWLKLTLNGPDGNPPGCYDFSSNPVGQSTASCYKNWLSNGSAWSGNASSTGFNIDPGSGTTTATLGVDPDPSHKYWVYNVIPSGNAYGLDMNQNIGGNGFQQIYMPRTAAGPGSSGFYRKITLAADRSAPYFSTDVGPRLLVTVEVWWTDKQCPATDVPPASGRCYVKLQTSLTNWKNYQP